MPRCAATNCTNIQTKDCGKSFHVFPKDKERRKAWVTALRRKNFTPSNRAVLCSDHFEDSYFDRTGQTVRLRSEAIPSLFEFSEKLQKHARSRKQRKVQSAMKTSSPATKTERTQDNTASEPLPSSIEDHTYFTSRNLQSQSNVDKTVNIPASCKPRLKTGQQDTQCLNRNLESLRSVAEDLRNANLISDQCVHILEETFMAVPLELIKHLLKNDIKEVSIEDCSPALKTFALTLLFFSSDAYNCVRETLSLGFPQISVIHQWYSALNGSPGFATEVFSSLEEKAEEARVKGEDLMCSLVIGEMPLKKHVEWDGQDMLGFVDMGTGLVDESRPVATDVLVFMIVSLKCNWKIPVGYFLVSGLLGEYHANLVKICIGKLYAVGVTVVSLTCDGPSCHFSMMRELGACMTPPDFNPSFSHPSKPGQSVHVLLDAGHMLKLMRHLLASSGIIKDQTGHEIKWDFIKQLHELQQNEGPGVCNKFKSVYVDWEKQKMKVSLAAQTLGTSVADAILFCRNTLNLPEFEHSLPTADFICTIDHVFNTLNSRNPLAKGYKAPLRSQDEGTWMPLLDHAYEYLSGLTDEHGTSLYRTGKKTAVIGFMCCIRTVQALYHAYVKPDGAPLKYLLTHKLSQDHLEMFFDAIRSSSGCSNDNPTAGQFITAYKQLLMSHKTMSSSGHCEPQEDKTVLECCDVSEMVAPDSTEGMEMAQ
ncbi:calcium binding protein 39, like 1 isoform X1 [Thalassophryne amazonica]|uniref:calcium binding protein 39, like 1 isoform X1 n=1 Tax=Thalassophryne amazonica TaxID=390379 RepID=UPI0014724642|nr:calcium binding protein 39, like 1 isoform X1 [Thalassophryne amazonica]